MFSLFITGKLRRSQAFVVAHKHLTVYYLFLHLLLMMLHRHRKFKTVELPKVHIFTQENQLSTSIIKQLRLICSRLLGWGGVVFEDTHDLKNTTKWPVLATEDYPSPFLDNFSL